MLGERIVKAVLVAYYWLVVFTILYVSGAGLLDSIIESLLIIAALIVGVKTRIRFVDNVWFLPGSFLVPLFFSIEVILRSDLLFSLDRLVVFIIAILIGGLGVYLLSSIHSRGVYVDFLLSIIYLSSLGSVASNPLGGSLYETYALMYPLTLFSLLLGLETRAFLGRVGGYSIVIGGDGLLDALVLIPITTPPLTTGLTLLFQFLEVIS